MEGFSSPWQELRRQICDELTKEDLRQVLFLMKDILGSEYNTLKASEDPEQLFTFLETIMSEVEATRLLKQVLADLNYWPQFSDRSFRDIIQAYEDKTKEFEDRFGSSRDEYFVGRENEIIKIKKHLTSVSKGIWLSGEGGMGKTTLAREVCYRLNIFHNVQTVNVNLKGKGAAADVARGLLMARNETVSSSILETLFSQAITSVVRLSKAGHDFIILLDSLEDCLEEDVDGTCGFLENLLSVLPQNVKVLVTSRMEIEELPRLQLGYFEQVRLLPLGQEDAMTLLKISSRPRRLTDDDCAAIFRFCGLRPLAIRVFSRAIQYCSEHQVELPIQSVQQMVEIPLLEVIKYSYEHLDEQNRQIFLCLSVFENSLFETDEVAFVTQRSALEASMSVLYLIHKNLVEVEQVQREKEGKRLLFFSYYLHPIVLKFLNQMGRPKRAELLFVEFMLKKIQNVEDIQNERFVEAFSFIRDRSASIKTLFVHLQHEPAAFSIMRNSYLYKLSVFYGSPAHREELLSNLAENHASKGHKKAALYWQVVRATTVMDDGDYDKAEQYLKRIETDAESPVYDVNLAYVQGEYFLSKGRIHIHKNRYSESEDCLLKAKNLYLQSGDERARFSEVARALNALGNVHYKRRDYEKSFRYHQEACDVMKRYLIDYNNLDLSVYKFNLGTVKVQEAERLRDIDRPLADQLYTEGLEELNASIDIDEKLNLRRLPNYPTKLLQRSRLHHRMGHYDEAVKDAEEAIKLREETYGQNHRLVTEAYSRLATLWYNRHLNKKQGTHESRKQCLIKAYRYCLEIEKQIREGSLIDQDCEAILRLYTDVANALNDEKIKEEVRRFCRVKQGPVDVLYTRTATVAPLVSWDVRTRKLFASDDDDASVSTPSSPKSSLSSDEEPTNLRHDSGLADSVSTPDDADIGFQNLSFRQVSTESAVFDLGLDSCPEPETGTQPGRKSLKRQRSLDSD